MVSTVVTAIEGLGVAGVVTADTVVLSFEILILPEIDIAEWVSRLGILHCGIQRAPVHIVVQQIGEERCPLALERNWLAKEGAHQRHRRTAVFSDLPRVAAF